MNGTRLVVVGIGPAGADLVAEGVTRRISRASRVFLRTARHPSSQVVFDSACTSVITFDDIYETAHAFEDVYHEIVEDLVEAVENSPGGGEVVYAVPGSPLVAEKTVALLRADARIEVEIVPGISFLDLVWERVGTDPVSSSVRVVDGVDFGPQAAGERGPLVVAQVYSRSILSSIKIALDDPPPGDSAVTVLHHLGLSDERVAKVRWEELDRLDGLEPDHLTSLWIPELAIPVASEIVRLEELVRTLRTNCPWDREQSHGSLARHLLEEAYEALDAIEDVAAAGPDVPEQAISHLEEELGDLAFQVVFHSVIAAEEGWFTLADVARRLVDKLVQRHPHVFADAVAETPEDVARSWEALKLDQLGRSSVTDGIPQDLPALALVAKLQRKAESLGIPGPDSKTVVGEREDLLEVVDRLFGLDRSSSGETLEAAPETVRDVGDALVVLADLARRAGVDPESALRARARVLAAEIRKSESSTEQDRGDFSAL